MTECRRCGGKAQLYLCQRCTTTLQRTLTDLPWWLNRLTEAAVGQTRMSDNAGRKSAARRDLDGETPLAACIEPFPDTSETDLERARRQRQRVALAHALAAGGINARASELLGQIADSLAYWVKELCDSRGVDYTPPVMASERLTALGTAHAAWMARHVGAIAASELAEDICGDVEGHLDDIVRIVNRPVPIRTLGKCPTWIDGRDGQPGQPCGRQLRAPAEDSEVYCARCKATHSVNRLLLARFAEAERELLTFDRLCKVNRMQPEGFQVPLRTLQQWRKTGALPPRGWMRPGGLRGIAWHGDDDQPLYLWADVRMLRSKRPQADTTGAAAHKTRR